MTDKTMNVLTDMDSLQPADLDAGEVFSATKSGRMVHGFVSPSSFDALEKARRRENDCLNDFDGDACRNELDFGQP